MNASKAELIERAGHARRILSDAVFVDALTAIRVDALMALASVDAMDTQAINRLQAIVQVTDEIKDQLEAAIKATGQMDGGYSLSNSPDGE